jgi:subtilisin family serine protease
LTTYAPLVGLFVGTRDASEILDWRRLIRIHQKDAVMPVPGRFNGVLLRHDPAFAFTEIGMRSIPSASALQLRRYIGTLKRRENMPSVTGRTWSTMNFDSTAHPWDAAHAVADASAASNGDEHAYAEPNLEFSMPHDLLMRSAAAGKPCDTTEGERLCMWPPAQNVPPKDWHLDRSGLRRARLDPAFHGLEADPARWRVRIGHLDTGYSDVHETKPRGLRVELARNVLADPPTNNAIDPATTTDLLSSPGHGTATLGILAGSSCSAVGGTDLGGVPFANVVPVRMSDFVWHIWTDVIPKAIQWALQTQCNIINLSHGGLATRAWVDAVNAAYDAGCVICAASGDNFGGLPMLDVVWPARFRRAIAVTGVTYNQRPYFEESFGVGVMEGNFGPPEAMNYAIAAYTPNVLWPKCRQSVTGPYTINGYDADGGGTSAATPQVTAAVALYLQKYNPSLMAMPGWQRVETIRAALFQSAQQHLGDPKHFGAGLLNAERMLQIDPATVGPVTNLDEDEITFGLLRHLPGWDSQRPGQQKMLEVEATQIAALNPYIANTVGSWEAHATIPQGAELIQFLDHFKKITTPRPSNLLYHLLDDATHT